MPINAIRLCSIEEHINLNEGTELYGTAKMLLREVHRLRALLYNAERIRIAQTTSPTYPITVPKVNYIVRETIHV